MDPLIQSLHIYYKCIYRLESKEQKADIPEFIYGGTYVIKDVPPEIKDFYALIKERNNLHK
jgi:hypothetical protein